MRLNDGVSFVVPVHNGASVVRDTLASVVAQADGRPMEIIVVDDCSGDGSSALLRELAREWPIVIVQGSGRGAAAAINAGIRAARFPIVCQVDQDVVLRGGWMPRLVAELDDPSVAAAQGYYECDPAAPWCARAMSLDLEQRYEAIGDAGTHHVCTGNAAYRASALHQVGLFDESFGYGYDNDMSYRLVAAGYRLRICRGARSTHRWRDGVAGYLGQQYGFGYGRVDLVAKHPWRIGGDSVSPARMMAHPVVMSAAIVGAAAALVMAAFGRPWHSVAFASALIVAGLAAERLIAGVAAARRFRDPAPLVFPVLHVARDLAWVAAIAAWIARRAAGRPSMPSHSMQPRRPQPSTISPQPSAVSPQPSAICHRTLIVIPAYNEGANLSDVVADLREARPDCDILVVDDGSTDETAWLADRLDVRWLRLPERIGVGGAMRAGLRYAARRRYEVVVRVDGDGQHRAEDIERLLAPVVDGRADAVIGSRWAAASGAATARRRVAQRMLGQCMSFVIGHRVTDPTSGFWVLGPRAVRLLARHHPAGYPEPELRLLLSRSGLSVVEVPVHAHERLRGRTSLTPLRIVTAGARVILALLVVPLRRRTVSEE